MANEQSVIAAICKAADQEGMYCHDVVRFDDIRSLYNIPNNPSDRIIHAAEELLRAQITRIRTTNYAEEKATSKGKAKPNHPRPNKARVRGKMA